MSAPRIPDHDTGRELAFRHATLGAEEVLAGLVRAVKEARHHAAAFTKLAESAEETIELLETMIPDVRRQLGAVRGQHRRLLGELAEARGEAPVDIPGDQGSLFV